MDFYEILKDTVYSLQRVLIGVSAALLIGVFLGFFRSRLPQKLKKNVLFNFIVDFAKYPPPIAWIPFVIFTFGIGELAAYVIVFIGAVSPIFTSTYQSIENIPRPLIWSAKSLQLGFMRKLSFYFYASLPGIVTGLRTGIGMGWMSVIAAEMISGQSGLGYAIQLHRINMQYSEMLVLITVIGFVGLLLNLLVNQLDQRISLWCDR